MCPAENGYKSSTVQQKCLLRIIDMGGCLERCNEFARTKPARIILGIVMVLICCAWIYTLLNASNKLNDERTSHLQLVSKPAEEGSLLYFAKSNEHKWSEEYKTALSPYTYPRPIIRKCDANHPPVPGEPCELDVKIFGPCSPNYIDQQSTAELCVFLKVRHDQEWNPEFYTNSSDLPEDMPRKLSEEIAKNPLKASKMAWISCDGELPADQDNIGNIDFFPHQGFEMFTIGTGEVEYEPILALHFQRLTRGVVVSVKCKLWTKNSRDQLLFNILLD